jgi:ribosomal protein S20
LIDRWRNFRYEINKWYDNIKNKLCDKIKNSGVIMKIAKEEVRTLLDRLPDNCTIEDIQYHLYVIEKVQRGIERAEKEGTIEQEEVEKKLSKWILK